MEKSTVTIRVEGADAADSSESASELRDLLLNSAIERNVSNLEIKMDRSHPDAQDVTGDILNIFHTGVLTGLFIVETIKLWHETRRDKALIIEAQRGSAIRVELNDPGALKTLEQAISSVDASSKPK